MAFGLSNRGLLNVFTAGVKVVNPAVGITAERLMAPKGGTGVHPRMYLSIAARAGADYLERLPSIASNYNASPATSSTGSGTSYVGPADDTLRSYGPLARNFHSNVDPSRVKRFTPDATAETSSGFPATKAGFGNGFATLLLLVLALTLLAPLFKKGM